MIYDQINKKNIEENMALTYRQSNEAFIEKARQAEPVGTIKTMGGREVIKTPNGWRAHTKNSGAKTKEHLEKNPSANHKDEHLQKFSKETPAKELQRVIKESTDPRLREHAQVELTRRKNEETGKTEKPVGKTKSGKNIYNDAKHSSHSEFSAADHEEAFRMHDDKVNDLNPSALSKVSDENPDKQKAVKDREHHIAQREHHRSAMIKASKKETAAKKGESDKGRVETKEAHEKRGFDESKGDEDVTGKSEKIPKDDKFDLKKEAKYYHPTKLEEYKEGDDFERQDWYNQEWVAGKITRTKTYPDGGYEVYYKMDNGDHGSTSTSFGGWKEGFRKPNKKK
jgi:hypothetical protein